MERGGEEAEERGERRGRQTPSIPHKHTEPLAGHLNNPLNIKRCCRPSQVTTASQRLSEDAMGGKPSLKYYYEKAAKSTDIFYFIRHSVTDGLLVQAFF